MTGHIITRIGQGINIDIARDILVATGVDSLIASIRSTVDAPEREVVGILTDANDRPDERWQSITDRLRESNRFRGTSLPASPAPEGTIIPEGSRSPRVGIWLMPDNQVPGELEDFVAAMIPNGDPVWPRARDYIDGIPEADRRFADGKTERAKVHAWLAAREDPRRMGAAIGAGDLDTEVPPCQSFAAWLRQIFAS